MYAQPFVEYLQLSLLNHCSREGHALPCYSGGTVVHFQFNEKMDMHD